MPARSCSTCATNWPTATGFDPCPICEERTSFTYTRNPDFSEAEAKAYVEEHRAQEAVVRAAPKPEHANRVDRYLALGFSEVDAQVLALATRVHVDSTGREWVRHVNHLDVARALASGCSHALALEIFR